MAVYLPGAAERAYFLNYSEAIRYKEVEAVRQVNKKHSAGGDDMALQKTLNRTVDAMVVLLFVSLFLLLSPNLARSGTSYSGCRYECKFTKVTFNKKNSNRSTYHLHAQCSWKVYGNAACPPGGTDSFTGTGWWDKYLKMAYEEIQFTGSYHISTLAKCTSNPWLGSWVDCTKIQRDIDIDNYNPLPDYTPVSAKLMSYDNKKELQQEEDSAIVKIQAPHIQRPIDNIIFGRVFDVPVIIDHLKEYKLAYEFQHRDSASKPFQPINPGELHTVQRPSPEGSGKLVISTVTFYPKTRGDFRVRARCAANLVGWGLPEELSEWAEWTTFSIDEPPSPTVLTPGNGRQFDLSEQILIETEHDAKYPVTFSFTRKAFTSGPVPTGSYPIEPATKNCSSAARDGVESISCYYTFDKTGDYTFSIKLASADTLAVTRTFKITRKERKKIKAIPVLTFQPPEIIQPAFDGLKFKLNGPVKVKVSFNPDLGLIKATVRCAPKLASWQEPEPWQTCNDYSRKIEYPGQGSIIFTYYFSWVGQHKVDVIYKNSSLSKATRSFEVLNEIDPSSITFLSPTPSRKYTFSEKIPITIKHTCGNNANLFVRYFMKPETEPGEWPEVFQPVSPAKTYADAFPSGVVDPVYSDYTVHVNFNRAGIYKVEAVCSSMTAPVGIRPSREFLLTGPTPAPKILKPNPWQKFTLSDTIRIETEYIKDRTIYYSFKRYPDKGLDPATALDVAPLTKGCSFTFNNDLKQTICFCTFEKAGIYEVYAKDVELASLLGSRNFEIISNQGSIHPVTLVPGELQKKQNTLQPSAQSSYKPSPEKNIHRITFGLNKKRFTNPKAVQLVLNNPSGQKLVFDFQRKEKGGFFRHVSRAPTVIFNHAKGKSVATLKEVHSGEWRVRTRSVKAGSPWSKWHIFSVVSFNKTKAGLKSQQNSKTLHKNVNKPAIPPVINKPKNNQTIQKRYKVTFQIQHSKDSKLRFEFGYRKKPGTGSYSSHSVNMSSLKTSHTRTEGSIAFKKEGEYRFRVREVQQGARWSKWRIFTMKASIKGDMKQNTSRKSAMQRSSTISIMK